MAAQKRKYNLDEKLQILHEAEQYGVEPTMQKYGLSSTIYYVWKEKFTSKGIEGLHEQYRRIDPELRALEKENERLRKIVAKQALEIEVKDELLKKK